VERERSKKWILFFKTWMVAIKLVICQVFWEAWSCPAFASRIVWDLALNFKGSIVLKKILKRKKSKLLHGAENHIGNKPPSSLESETELTVTEMWRKIIAYPLKMLIFWSVHRFGSPVRFGSVRFSAVHRFTGSVTSESVLSGSVRFTGSVQSTRNLDKNWNQT
jgi:hypothetical protein